MKNLLLIFAVFCCSTTLAQKNEITLVSWNIQHFGQSKSSAELKKIAAVVKDADIVAVQEVVAGYGGPQAVAKLTAILNGKGAIWDYIVSAPTNSSKYMTERYAFIWKPKHIKIKNRGYLITDLQNTVEREPLIVDFYVGSKRFSILNFHSISHRKNPRPEIKALTKYMMNGRFTYPVILAGDFNVNEGDLVFKDFLNSGYHPSVFNKKTTLKSKCLHGQYLNYSIDNIYFSKRVSKIDSGVIDHVLVCDEIENARKLSDHLPVYLTFSLDR